MICSPDTITTLRDLTVTETSVSVNSVAIITFFIIVVYPVSTPWKAAILTTCIRQLIAVIYSFIALLVAVRYPVAASSWNAIATTSIWLYITVILSIITQFIVIDDMITA